MVVTCAAAAEGQRAPAAGGELLYNGIQLPKEWPPKTPIRDRSVRPVPYLMAPPAVIPIDVGRQLFVDDFLIEKTDLNRTFHRAQRFEDNPILKPETELEKKGPVATLFNDGVWFDPTDQLFKMWYHAGWFDGTAYATSKDGFKWDRPNLDVVPGSNRVLPKEGHGNRDGTAIWLDLFETNPEQRFKMYIYERPKETYGGRIFTSGDGIHWTDKGLTRVGDGDNTTFFYNPFRKKWVYSIRLYRMGRARDYWETDDITKPAHTQTSDHSPWVSVDELDKPDPGLLALMPSAAEIQQEALTNKTVAELTTYYRSLYGDPPQLYNLDAVGYESVMLGVFSILKGPTSSKGWNKHKMVKINDLEFGYSRDGFHWDRPDRTPFLSSTRKEGDWDRGYLHTTSGICAIVGDKLYFFYGGWSGIGPKGPDVYSGGAIGLAFLRRDGFASMDAGEEAGFLTTRPVTFQGKHLFVNLKAPGGELRVEALDEQGRVIAPFSMDNCIAVSGDTTRQRVAWKGASDLSKVAGTKVRFRFQLRSGELYAFWVTPDAGGASFGYVAAGGPEFKGPIDNGKQ
ncbi:MAG TPA: glycosyl hydrolase family 32 [Verrucomicrobiae bacterium]|nr:glycosyl hydrolase family 32 [Verrucomicrobiae bacterium]